MLEPTGVLTSYTYDLLDNLTGVSAQCLSGYTCTPVGSTGQTRTFSYSTLSRQMSAQNPETGNLAYTYTYDANGNVKTRTDANNTVTTVTGYDGLNRPLGVTYSPGTITLSSGAAYSVAATPSVTYNYDKNSLGTGFTGFVGAPSSVSSSAGSRQYSYDGFGRVSQSRQTTPLGGQAYLFSNYSYSLTDQLTGMTYPSGRAVTYTLDAADEVTGASGALAGGMTTYASGIQYMAAGGVTSLPMGNGITESRTWNNLMEQTSVSAGNLSLGYNYCNNGTSQCASGNTGSPFQQTIGWTGQTQAVQQFTSDGVNRITSASEQQGSSTAWSRQYSYDNLGNMTQTPPPGGTTWTAGSFNAKNQVADANWVYDNAGNVIGAGTGGPMLQYDAENRLVKACGASSCTAFSYDAAGNRVQRTDSSSQSSTTTTFVYDAFGNLAADYGAPANAAGTQYVAVDAMGSTRLVMDGSAVERHDFEPYGAELSGGWRTPAAGYGSATLRQRFTGQERDDDTTLDYFLARYYSGTQGRFGSPDPGNAGANPGDPQSWNGYAYVSGNPLTFTDPSGQFLDGAAAGALLGEFGEVGIVIGAAVELGELADLLFGGGSKPDLSSVAFTPGPVQPLTGGADTDQYAAQASADSGGQSDPDSLFGGGNTGPFAFSFADGDQGGFWTLDYKGVPYWYVPTGPTSSGAQMKAAPRRNNFSVAGTCVVDSLKEHLLGIGAATAAGYLPKQLVGVRQVGSTNTTLLSKLGSHINIQAARSYGPGARSTTNLFRGLGRALGPAALIINAGELLKTGQDAARCYDISH